MPKSLIEGPRAAGWFCDIAVATSWVKSWSCCCVKDMFAVIGVVGFDGFRVNPNAATAEVKEVTIGSSFLSDEDEGLGDVRGLACDFDNAGFHTRNPW